MLLLLALAGAAFESPGGERLGMALRAARGRGDRRADSARRNRRYRVLGAQRGHADHRRQRRQPGRSLRLRWTGWYRYSTVCGGHEGRIAWAGPDNFWTISDQPSGQQTGSAPPHHISLCHFEGGKVVASYAEPVGLAKSYLPLNAAACSGPQDCWFAGERLPGTTNVGAFHLHWDGSSLTAVPSLTVPQPEIEDPGRSVTSLAFHGGNLYEGVRSAKGTSPPLSWPISPAFCTSFSKAPRPIISFRSNQKARRTTAAAPPSRPQLQGFRLAGDSEELWAIAGAESEPATVTALRLGGGGFEQVSLDDPAALSCPAIGSTAPPRSPVAKTPGSPSANPATKLPPRRA